MRGRVWLAGGAALVLGCAFVLVSELDDDAGSPLLREQPRVDATRPGRTPANRPRTATTSTRVQRAQRPLGPRGQRRVLRGQMQVALRRERDELAHCLPEGQHDFGGAVVNLEVMTLDQATRIEDVTIIAGGAATQETLDCVGTVLRGKTLETPSAIASPGRGRVSFRLDS